MTAAVRESLLLAEKKGVRFYAQPPFECVCGTTFGNVDLSVDDVLQIAQFGAEVFWGDWLRRQEVSEPVQRS